MVLVVVDDRDVFAIFALVLVLVRRLDSGDGGRGCGVGSSHSCHLGVGEVCFVVFADGAALVVHVVFGSSGGVCVSF